MNAVFVGNQETILAIVYFPTSLHFNILNSAQKYFESWQNGRPKTTMRHGNNVQSAALGFRPLVSIVLNKVPPQCQPLLSSICKSVDCWQACMRHSKTLETVHARNSYYSKELKQRTQYFQEVHFSIFFSKSTLKIFRFFPYGTFFC